MTAPVLEVLSSGADLEAIRGEWQEVWETSGTSPFQSPAWLLPWWREIGKGDLLTPVVREAGTGRLLGLLPLYLYRDEGASGRRKLLPLGVASSDFLDLIARPEAAEACARAVLEFIASTGHLWDECSLPQLAERSPLASHAASILPGTALSAGEPCPRLRLPARAEEFRKGLSHGMAQGLRTAEHRAARSGGAAVEIAARDNFARCFETFLLLHSLRRRQRGEPGFLSHEGAAPFLRQSAEGLLDQGRLRLYLLTIGGEPAAALLGFTDRALFFYYLGGLDPRLAFFSPGNLLIEHAAVQHIREGGEVFEFLRGREEYKYRWGAADVPTLHLSIGSPTKGPRP